MRASPAPPAPQLSSLVEVLLIQCGAEMHGPRRSGARFASHSRIPVASLVELQPVAGSHNGVSCAPRTKDTPRKLPSIPVAAQSERPWVAYGEASISERYPHLHSLGTGVAKMGRIA